MARIEREGQEDTPQELGFLRLRAFLWALLQSTIHFPLNRVYKTCTMRLQVYCQDLCSACLGADIRCTCYCGLHDTH